MGSAEGDAGTGDQMPSAPGCPAAEDDELDQVDTPTHRYVIKVGKALKRSIARS